MCWVVASCCGTGLDFEFAVTSCCRTAVECTQWGAFARRAAFVLLFIGLEHLLILNALRDAIDGNQTPKSQ
jgi:hypothetical protein